jgi:hypothetical protein
MQFRIRPRAVFPQVKRAFGAADPWGRKGLSAACGRVFRRWGNSTMTSGSTQQPAPPDFPPGQEPGGSENPKRGNIVATLGTIKDLLTNVVGIVTVLVSAAALFGGGAAVGHSAATSDPAPAKTVFVTVTPTATPTPAPTTEDPGQATTAPPTTAPVIGGTKLGSYTVNLNAGHSIPLGKDKPAQGDFSTNGLGDLGTGVPGGVLVFVPINGDKMVSLDSGATPSYDSCAADTIFATQADSKPGTAFCLIETGMLAGVKVVALHPAYVVLSVTVWSYSS